MSFANFQKKMFEKELPEVPSLLPKEKRDADLIENLKEFYDAHISAISKNPDLLPFIGDVFGISEKADISCIENLLKETPAVKEPFFEQKEALPQKEVASASSFRTASGKVLEEAGSNKSSGIERECNVDEYIVERIKREIIEKDLNVAWGDIVGLDDVKRIINEIVLWPISRPDIFTGLRKPPKGLLLFGPPGTGKTMIGKCIASQCKATFFSISASSLTSKWVGEGEKMVRALFYLARKMAPSVVFIDEIDSLLSQRSENENEGSRRIKTEFLVQFDGAGVENDDKHILIIGATNRPQEIDEAARRRLVKRVYVPLPDKKSRKAMIRELVTGYKNDIGEVELDEIARLTDGYSGSDIFNLCREATLEPLREIEDIKRLKIDEMRAIKIDDFYVAMRQIRKSVSEKDLNGYVDWNNSFGSMPRKTDKPKP